MTERHELINRPITTLDDAKAWIEELHDLGLSFNFSTDPSMVVKPPQSCTVEDELSFEVCLAFEEAEWAPMRLRIAELKSLEWGALSGPIRYLVQHIVSVKSR